MCKLSPVLLIIFMALVSQTVTVQSKQIDTHNDQHTLIAFISNRDGTYEIYTMNPDGSNQRRLTYDAHSLISTPAWSPDGLKIAFTSERDGNNEIYLINVDGSNLVNLTNSESNDASPTWSPDGNKIAFSTDRDGYWEIYMMDVDGSNPVNLTNEQVDDFYPNWSPDGSKIAFTRQLISNTEIYVMNANGSDQSNLTVTLFNEYFPVWSPDGSKIAYESERDGTGEIYVMDADGSNQVDLTNSLTRESSPTWSPDGLKIAFGSERGTPQVYVMDADGSNQVDLTQNSFPAIDYSPAWSPWLDGPAPISAPTAVVPISLTSTTLTCPNAPPSRLNVGMHASVAVPIKDGDIRRNLRVRDEPSGEQVGLPEPADNFIIMGKAICGEDGLLWWPIATLDGQLSGWSAEGFAPDDYMMVPEHSR